MEPVRFGLVGYGFGGRYFHAPLLAAAPECALLGVVTTAAPRRELVAREHPSASTFASLAELAAAGAEAVAISTPGATHTALTDEALRLGLAVVCDKPFALDADAARGSVRLAEDLGLPLAPYQNRRWDSDFLTVRRLLDEGALGDVTLFESTFERYSRDPVPPSGGGIARDFGSHLVDQALQLWGPVASVYGEISPADDRFFAALRHERGMTSHLSGDWVQGSPAPRFRVRGSEGAYVVYGMDGQEPALIAGERPGEDWYTEPPERWGRLQRGDESDPVRSERGRWDTFYPAFAAAVRGEGPVPVDPRDAVASLAVIDAIRGI
jgi:predicted dehydrogenase